MHLSELLQEQFQEFISNVPARRLRNNMNKLLFYFLKSECSSGLPDFMDPFLTDFLFFTDLLDTIDDEVDQSELL